GIDPPAQRDDRTVLSRWYQLVCWEPGHHLLKSPLVQYRTFGEEKQDASTDELGVTVESLLEKEPNASDIRDIKAPEPIPVDWRPYWILGGGILAAVLVAVVLHRVLNRPKRAAPAAPPRPPAEIAAAELERPRGRRLVEQGAFKEYYSALSDIVRRYLEHRFQLRAPEMTTEEFLLATARDGRLVAAHRPGPPAGAWCSGCSGSSRWYSSSPRSPGRRRAPLRPRSTARAWTSRSPSTCRAACSRRTSRSPRAARAGSTPSRRSSASSSRRGPRI